MLDSLYKIADNENIVIRRNCPEELVAIAIRFPDDSMLIALSHLMCAPRGASLAELLAHELGHCLTNSFYKTFTKEERRLCEDKANTWAIQHVMPLSEVEKAKACGVRSVRALSQRFRVSRDFVRRALAYYGT